MVDKRIRDLPSVSATTAGDVLPIDGATTRAISIEDFFTNIAINGGTFSGLSSPSLAGDAANKAYVDAVAMGLTPMPAVRLATAAVLPQTPTYSNGALGVGATLTAGSNAALVVDGTNAVLNDSVLVKNQASTFQNGIYTVTTVGSGAAAWVLTRRTDFDTAAEMLAGSYFLVTAGSTLAGGSYTLQATVTTVGTTAATFVQFSSSTAGVSSIGGANGVVTLASNVTIPGNVLTVAARALLSGALTYYVRSDGNDSNTGLADSAGGAFLTWQHAIDTALAWDTNLNVITIQHGAEGSHNFATTITFQIGTIVGGGSLKIRGSTTPGNTTFTNTVADNFLVRSSVGIVSFENVTFVCGGGSGCINITDLSTVNILNGCIFSTGPFAHIYVHDGRALVYILGASYTISGSALYHIFISMGSLYLESSTVTLTGTPNWTGGFVGAVTGGKMQCTATTFSGAATGPRFAVSSGASVNVFGQGINLFPGNSAGTPAPGTAVVSDIGGFYTP